MVAAVGSCCGLGCSTHRLQNGIWELSFQGQRSQNRKQFPIEKREVKLLVEWKDAGDGENVEISDIESGGDVLEPMFGDIEPEGDGSTTALMIDHQDRDWSWRMYGVIHDPKTVDGKSFFAKARGFEDLTIEGRWMLRWLRDE